VVKSLLSPADDPMNPVATARWGSHLGSRKVSLPVWRPVYIYCACTIAVCNSNAATNTRTLIPFLFIVYIK
jgi:hypothetical protein